MGSAIFFGEAESGDGQTLLGLMNNLSVIQCGFIQRAAKAVCFSAVLFTLTGCGMQQEGSKDLNVQIGDSIPAFALKDVEGNMVSSQELLGKPYVVAVFATWCPPCKMELAALEKDVWQPLKEKGVGVIGINFGDEDASLVSGFAEELGLTFPMLVDMPGKFRQEVGISAVPQSLVIGPDGKIINMHIGFTDESVAATARELEAAL